MYTRKNVRPEKCTLEIWVYKFPGVHISGNENFAQIKNSTDIAPKKSTDVSADSTNAKSSKHLHATNENFAKIKNSTDIAPKKSTDVCADSTNAKSSKHVHATNENFAQIKNSTDIAPKSRPMCPQIQRMQRVQSIYTPQMKILLKLRIQLI